VSGERRDGEKELGEVRERRWAVVAAPAEEAGGGGEDMLLLYSDVGSVARGGSRVGTHDKKEGKRDRRTK